MSDRSSVVFVTAEKEYMDALKSGLFLVVLAFLIVLSTVSIIVSSLQFQGRVAEYKESVKVLQSLGKTPAVPPEFYPLKLLRGFIDYVEIIGAILGILLGYYTISREKNQKTLQLVLTRPIDRRDIITGKTLGNAGMIFTVLALVGAVIYASILLVGGAGLSLSETAKLALTLCFSLLYVMIFFLLTAFLTLRMNNPANSLIAGLTIWLLITLILPQIGDTMDPDNQIPGGFFKSMGMSRAEEKDVIAKFGTYETIRNAIEESSITKHYERMCFALLGIKDEYNGKSLGYIAADKWPEAAWMIGFLVAGLLLCYQTITRRDSLFNETK